jgi:peptidyl-prolyl cis-trans isomerase D
MALIGKIRQKTGLLLGFIGVSMLIFLVQEGLSSNSRMGGSVKSLGKINGSKVETTEFFNEVTEYENRLKVLNPNFNMNEQNSMYVRDEVWNNIAFKNILGKTIERLGLDVNADELTEAFRGKNIHPLVMNVIGRNFVNQQTGQFDKAQMEQALSNLDAADPKLREIVIMLEPLVKEDRMRTKYASLVSKSAYYPTFIAKDRLADNKLSTADILSIPYSTIDDSKAPVSNEEIEKYIKDHSAQYKRNANVVLDIVTFDVVANLEDKQELANQLLQTKEELLTSDDDSLLIARSSIQGGNIIYMSGDDIKKSNRSKADSMMMAPVGSFIGPYEENGSVVLSYIADRKMIPDSVRASRIILQYKTADDVKTKKELAEKIVAEIKSGTTSFGQKASELSDDPSTKAVGGDIGVIPHGSLEPELNKKLFYEMALGEIQILESQNGVYIIQKTGQSQLKPATRVIDFENELVAGDVTAKTIYNQANDFYNKSKTGADFDANAKTKASLKDITVQARDINVANIAGSRPVVAWAFKDGKAGDVNFFDLSDKYAIVKVVAKNEKGLASVAEVKQEVTAKLMADKKAEIIKKSIVNSKTTPLTTLAEKSKGQVLSGIMVQGTNGFVDQIGVEPKVVGAILGTKDNTQSNPIAGNNGVYVVKTLSSQSMSGDVDLNALKKQLYTQNASGLSFEKIFDSVIKNANVEDERYLMY